MDQAHRDRSLPQAGPTSGRPPHESQSANSTGGQLPTLTSTRAPHSPGWTHSPSAFQPPATVPCMAALCLSFSIWEMECSTPLPRPLRTGLCLLGRACGLALKPVHTCPSLWYSGQVRLGKTIPWPRAHLSQVPSSSTSISLGCRFVCTLCCEGYQYRVSEPGQAAMPRLAGYIS